MPSLCRQSRRMACVYSTYQSTATITATPGDQIYYTSDGTNPTNLSTPYTVPIVFAPI
ncbi:MAG: chitobiase/beta-hexosaminidase C-terminal domain-containing protein [Candidatus Obscuribacter sp.]|nr:chitobiase/beta-hexosaminidase C-terminal domain-containing protein [Candidatus Obscuribacter sp.]